MNPIKKWRRKREIRERIKELEFKRNIGEDSYYHSLTPNSRQRIDFYNERIKELKRELNELD